MFENSKATKLHRLTSIPVETYINTFAGMSLEATNPALAAEIMVDGNMFMVGQRRRVHCPSSSFYAAFFFGFLHIFHHFFIFIFLRHITS